MTAEFSATFLFGVGEGNLLCTGAEGAELGKKMLVAPNTALLVAELGVVIVCI